MPYVETPADLAEWLANQIGVWGAEDRSPWVADVTERIRDSVANEQRLQPQDECERLGYHVCGPQSREGGSHE